MKQNQCWDCKYFAQGKTCSYCEHPNAESSEASYRYYNFSCDNVDKFEKGISQTRIDYMKKLK